MAKDSIAFMLRAQLESARNVISQMDLFELATDPSLSSFADFALAHNGAFPLLIIVHL
jgi:uncharacterized protein (DUF1778 family)